MAANYKKNKNFEIFFYLFKKSRLYLILRKTYITKKKTNTNGLDGTN